MNQIALAERCRTIDLLVLDVDGVLTDGGITVNDHGIESKQFHVRDGAGVAYWRGLGKRTAIISGRSCPSVDRRASELGIARVLQGRLDKGTALREVLAAESATPKQACMVGDDLADLPALALAGLAVAVRDASAEVRAAAHYVTRTPGGRGAVREVIELILRTQGHWNALVQSFRSG